MNIVSAFWIPVSTSSAARNRLSLICGSLVAVGIMVCPPMGRVLALQPPVNLEPGSTVADPDQEEPKDDWIKNEPAGARAQFKMPFKPVLRERVFTPVENQPPIKIYNFIGVSQDDQQLFLFNYHDLHQAPAETAVEDTLKEAMLQSLSNVRGRLIAEQAIRYRTNPGKSYEFRFARENQYYKGLARIFLVDNRHYQIAVMMKEEGFDQAVADKFLNSFRLIEPKPAQNEPQKDGDAQQGTGNADKPAAESALKKSSLDGSTSDSEGKSDADSKGGKEDDTEGDIGGDAKGG